jgi:glycosyltransferase involved in cell wall biosynthesis
MATSLPVVTTNIRGCREAVVDGSTGYIVRPRDAGALTDAVASLLDDPTLALKMGEAGRARASALFAESAVQKRFVTLINDGLRFGSPRN